MLSVQIGAILLVILLGYISARREYKNFTMEEKEQVKKELRNPILVFHILPYIGYFLFFIGLVFKINALKYIAFLLMGLGWIIDGAEIWKADSKQGLILILLGSITFLATTFLALEFLFNFSLL
ncbi:MAG: hypothetical protein U9Q88_15215 [Bacillota bacterium]|uniref:hypothetical protein n=1 Tax=Bacillus sp. RO2 TaxID=2723913 RepID=UPI00145E6A03|nr:hypothetical protein [Bacillus sp. RO2]MEA3321357.1 hypothetical protein [Bacillota bacterium]NMH73753.1 hypothetical protein [Bacillus sp. RO2]